MQQALKGKPLALELPLRLPAPPRFFFRGHPPKPTPSTTLLRVIRQPEKVHPECSVHPALFHGLPLGSLCDVHLGWGGAIVVSECNQQVGGLLFPVTGKISHSHQRQFHTLVPIPQKVERQNKIGNAFLSQLLNNRCFQAMLPQLITNLDNQKNSWEALV